MSTPSTVPVLDTSGGSTTTPQQAAPQAAPQQPAAAPPTPQVDASNPNALGGNTTAPSPIQQGVAAEPVNGPNWGARMLHGILAGLGGSSTTVYQPGPNGTMVATTQPKTQGQQWKTMIAGALSGVAASGAAGSGPGQIQRSIALGAGAGLQRSMQMHQQQQADEQQDFDQTQKAKVTNAQTSLLAQQTMASSFNLARAKVDATNSDIDRENTASQLLQNTPGARDLGVISMDPDKGDTDPSQALTRFVSGNPDLIKEMAQGNIQMVSAVQGGKVVGVHAFVLPQQWGAQKTTKDVTLTTFAKPDKPGDPPKEIPYTIPAGSVTNGDAMKYTMANSSESAKYYNEQYAQEQENERSKANNDTSARVANIDAASRERVAQLGRTPYGAMPGEMQPNPNTPGNGGAINQVPAQYRSAVQGLLNYQTDPRTFPTYVRPGSSQMSREQAINFAQTIDPTYDETQFNSRNKFRQSVTSGNFSKSVIALNTAIHHADTLNTAVQQLGNTSFPLLNSVRNAGEKATGGAKPGVVAETATALENELATVFKGTSGTNQEIKEWRDAFPVNGSQKQQVAAIQQAEQLMAGRLAVLRQQYQGAMGKPADFQILQPDSRQILARLGGQSVLAADGQQDHQQAPTQQGAPDTRQPRSVSGFSVPAGMVLVTIPGSAPGMIPAASVNAFKQTHPNGTVQ
jgi:hypothetical protein